MRIAIGELREGECCGQDLVWDRDKLVLFHSTRMEEAQMILKNGFRDATDKWGMPIVIAITGAGKK